MKEEGGDGFPDFDAFDKVLRDDPTTLNVALGTAWETGVGLASGLMMLGGYGVKKVFFQPLFLHFISFFFVPYPSFQASEYYWTEEGVKRSEEGVVEQPVKKVEEGDPDAVGTICVLDYVTNKQIAIFRPCKSAIRILVFHFILLFFSPFFSLSYSENNRNSINREPCYFLLMNLDYHVISTEYVQTKLLQSQLSIFILSLEVFFFQFFFQLLLLSSFSIIHTFLSFFFCL